MPPKAEIRAYDVMAEWQRLNALDRGLGEEHAQGYGIWLATVIAAQVKYGKRIKLKDGGRRVEGLEGEVPSADGWHYLDRKRQDDKLFNKNIIQRMGEEFYENTFVSIIAQCYEKGLPYEVVRDEMVKAFGTPRRLISRRPPWEHDIARQIISRFL